MLLSAIASTLVFLATMGGTCDDIGGVPTWDRCTSWLGTPLLIDFPSGILDLIIPLTIALAIGAAVWWLFGLLVTSPTRDTSSGKTYPN